MMRVRVVVALSFLAACGGMTVADEDGGMGQPPKNKPSARFISCKVGPQVGSVMVEGSWADCTGAGMVQVSVVPVDAQGKLQLSKAAQLNAPPAILATSSWTGTIKGLTTGHKVIAGGIEVHPPPPPGGGATVSMAVGVSGQLNVIVP